MMRTLKWLPAIVAPVVVAGAVLGAGAVAGPAFASQTSVTSSAHTPTPAQVLALIAKAKDAHYSGTVAQTSDLGLPELPAGATGGSDAQASGILDLLTASHTARVYVDGPTKQRVQVLDSLAERDLVRNGTEVWTWDSATDQAVHATLPSNAPSNTPTPGTMPTATPQSLAEQLVATAGRYSTLAVSKGSQAGRATWRVTVTPKASGTLVDKAVLSVDASTGVPLAVQLDARGQTSPAVSVAFSSIDFGVPAASNFSFTPPKGAKVTEQTVPSPSPHASGPASPTGSTVTGSGWTSILAVPASALGPGVAGLSADQADTLNELTQSVAGGRGLQTSLFSVLLTTDGRLYAGAVPLSALESAAQ
jgi:outer membrane lipoprotein-sorting protein